MTDFMQPHQTAVVDVDRVQGRFQGRFQPTLRGVEFYDDSSTVVELSLYSVPPFTMSEKTVSNKPVKSFRLRGITASVFENQSEDGKSTFYKVTLQRSYKQDDEWPQGVVCSVRFKNNFASHISKILS